MSYIIEKWNEILIFLSKSMALILIVVGFAGVAFMLAHSPKDKYTLGQKTLMYFTGILFSVLIGMFLTKVGWHGSFIALSGYFVAVLSNGFIVYTIENQQSLFHKSFTIVHGVLDAVIEKVTPKKESENE